MIKLFPEILSEHYMGKLGSDSIQHDHKQSHGPRRLPRQCFEASVTCELNISRLCKSLLVEQHRFMLLQVVVRIYCFHYRVANEYILDG